MNVKSPPSDTASFLPSLPHHFDLFFSPRGMIERTASRRHGMSTSGHGDGLNFDCSATASVPSYLDDGTALVELYRVVVVVVDVRFSECLLRQEDLRSTPTIRQAGGGRAGFGNSVAQSLTR